MGVIAKIAVTAGSILITAALSVAVTLFTLRQTMEMEFLSMKIDQRIAAGWSCLDFQRWVIEADEQGLGRNQIYRQADRAIETADVDEEIGENTGAYFVPCAAEGREGTRRLIDEILLDRERG